MTEKLFQDFVKFAKDVFGYTVYRTTPEKALVVGSFYEGKSSNENDYCLSINEKELSVEEFSVFPTDNEFSKFAA